MADKRIFQLSETSITDGKFVAVDKSGQASAERLSLSALISSFAPRAGSQNISSGTTSITFGTAFPTGTSYVIWIWCIADGFDIGGTTSNETETGFDVTVSEGCAFKYLAAIIL